MLGTEAIHGILGATPSVDLLGTVANHDDLTLLVCDNALDARVGILRLVKQGDIAGKLRIAHRPQLEVDVVLESQSAAISLDEILPRAAGIRRNELAQFVDVSLGARDEGHVARD